MFTLMFIYKLYIITASSQSIKRQKTYQQAAYNYHVKLFFSDYGLPEKIMSDTGGYFNLDKLKRFCQNLNI